VVSQQSSRNSLPLTKLNVARRLSRAWLLGETDAVARVITKLNDEEFAQILSKRVVIDIPDEVKARALKAYHNLLDSMDGPFTRIRSVSRYTSWMEITSPGSHLRGNKDDLTAVPPEPVADSDQQLLRSALE